MEVAVHGRIVLVVILTDHVIWEEDRVIPAGEDASGQSSNMANGRKISIHFSWSKYF